MKILGNNFNAMNKKEGYPFIQQQILTEIKKMNEKLDTLIQLLSQMNVGT